MTTNSGGQGFDFLDHLQECRNEYNICQAALKQKHPANSPTLSIAETWLILASLLVRQHNCHDNSIVL